jgi:hypothetical protein
MGDIGEEEKKERIYEPIPQTVPISEPSPVVEPEKIPEPV